MTDPGTADRTYIGPMTPELVEEIIEKVTRSQRALLIDPEPLCTSIRTMLDWNFVSLQERPDAVLPTMGGQTALNLAKALSEVRSATQYALECKRIGSSAGGTDPPRCVLYT